MKQPGLTLLYLVAFLILLGLPSFAGENRDVQSLDGAWAFKLDPDNAGETEKWYSPAPAFTGEITVPGAWDAQGYGEETDKLHHNYVGKGWYKRELTIPAGWDGKRVFIRFGGVYRYAKVWVNGQYLGEHIGYVSDFEYDITDAVKAGEKAIIAIQIDSEQRWNVDTMLGCMDIIDHLFTYWGGIWGHVSLEARAQAWTEDVFVQPKYSPASCSVTATVAGDKTLADEARLEILSTSGEVVAQSKQPVAAGAQIQIDAAIPGANLWTPETPYLYTARLSLLRQGEVLDRQETRFGLRTIEIQGTNFLLNGKKYYMNGYGDDCVYPETICPPSDKEYYLKRLRLIKSYGFNHVRHHSHFVTPEYYAACDELGMLVSPELPIGYEYFYARAGAEALELYKTEWAAAIKHYRNHPSIFDWCMGNEMWNGVAIAPDLYRIAKELDPTRPVIDTDGIFPDGFTDGKKDRPTLDFYTVMFNILTSPFDNPDKFKTGIPAKPVITHEEGNFVTFPRLDVIDEFRHDFKPFWLTPVKERIEKAGLWDEVLTWSEKSERLYYECHKANIEALRKNPHISGYHWWLFRPWYPGSNGLVDVYDRPVSISPEQVRMFNGPVVVLQDGLAQTYRGNQALELSLLVSNYLGIDFENASLTYRVKDASNTLATDTLSVARVANGELVKFGAITVPLPNPATPQRVFIEATLDAAGKQFKNEWSTWVYPSETPIAAPAVPLYASADLMAPLAAWNPQPIPDGPLPTPAVYVVRQPSMTLLEAAQAGSSVVCLSPAGVFPADVTSYKPAWWLGVFPGDSNAGTRVYDHPVTRDIAPDGWCDPAWFTLLQGAQTVLLDDLPAQPNVLIRALNTHSAPSGFSRYADFDFMWRNKSLLFETKVGEGVLIISGLNFDLARRRGGPEGPWMLTRLIEYAAGLPTPEAEVPFDYLRRRMDDSLFTKGPLVSGFSKVTFFKGQEATITTGRDAKASLYRINQQEPMHRIEWETAVTPQAERVTFAFAGSTAFQTPAPGTPGFGLRINGKNVLLFNTTQNETLWKSGDGRSALLFVPSPGMPTWSEATGTFYASVPGDLLTPGRPSTLSVHSCGGARDRWFGLIPDADL
ncbi:MAG: glycoside hydrolase family 2 TIM barrel-domain containing protein [FCB group bacterium]|nr:glycoside hydrolase family 2 TIM barrel-domain containing protein [FCB group bacterium]